MTRTMPHTQGQAKVVDCRNQQGGQIRLFVGWEHVANVRARGPNPSADARRLAALWNDAAGIPTESLEKGALHQAREALEEVEKAFQTWISATPIGEYHRVFDRVSAVLRLLRGELPSEVK